MTTISTVEELEEIYGTPGEASLVKESPVITHVYRQLIMASPFVALATVGPDGLDCSPRGDSENVVHIQDQKTLLLPDRRGNNRMDSLRNIVVDPRVGLMFLIPGSGTTLRVNGTAVVSTDAALLEMFAEKKKLPRSVIVITVETVYFQCARAIVRSNLWNPDFHVDESSIPTPGKILSDMTARRIDGDSYDAEWPERAAESLW